MDEGQALAYASQAVDRARKLGAEHAEATVSSVRRLHVEARGEHLAKLESTTGKSLHVRVFTGGRKATLMTSDLAWDAVDSALQRAIEQAAFVAPDPYAGLPELCASDRPELALYDPALAQREDAAKVQDALALERLIRAYDPRITNSGGSHYGDAIAITAIANSAGFASAYTSTRASRSTAPLAQDGVVKRIAHYGTAARALAELDDVELVARIAGSRAIEMFGARKPPTMRVPVIFERDVAAAVLDDLFTAISAASVASGNSWATERIGERIGGDLVTIVDDGRMPGLLGSSPFDGEGVATRRTTVFDRGRLETFLYDSYYARKLGAQSTGNSTGGGIGANSFYLEPGEATLEALIASTARGVLVLDTIGFATEHASGNYSRGARGFFIEGGELAYPIDECTIAGQFDQMLAGIDAVASDLRFDGSIVSPSFRVAEMTVSGT